MPTVFVIGRDWTFRAPLRAELREQGLEALGFETAADALAALLPGPAPALVVLDAASAEAPADALAQFRRVSQLLCVLSAMEPPPPGLRPDEVLRKPVQVSAIVAAVRHLMEGHPA